MNNNLDGLILFILGSMRSALGSAVTSRHCPGVAWVLWRLLPEVGVVAVAISLPLVLSVPVSSVRLGVIHSPPNHLLLVVLLQVGPVDLHGQVVEPGPGKGAQVTRDYRDDPPETGGHYTGESVEDMHYQWLYSVKTPGPQPASRVNTRGARSRAGLIAHLKLKLFPTS